MEEVFALLGITALKDQDSLFLALLEHILVAMEIQTQPTVQHVILECIAKAQP